MYNDASYNESYYMELRTTPDAPKSLFRTYSVNSHLVKMVESSWSLWSASIRVTTSFKSCQSESSKKYVFLSEIFVLSVLKKIVGKLD